MRTITVIINYFLILILLISCATTQKKYSDIRDLLNKMIRTYEMFIDEVDKVEDGDDVKKAIYKFIDNMGKLDEKGNELQLKYPELNDDNNVPKQLLELQEKLIKTATSERTKATSIIILSYTSDPEVQRAANMLSLFLDGE